MFPLQGGSPSTKLYVDDVFNAYTYTGNGSTQTINNGIDLAGKGGLVWLKTRSVAQGHRLHDTVRGAANSLQTHFTNASEATGSDFTSFNGNGFTLGVPAATSDMNGNGNTAVSWTFRKAPKFFDIVTYTGDNTSNRVIPHSLKVVPGMIIVKSTTSVLNWAVYHTSLGTSQRLTLNLDNAAASSGLCWGSTSPTSTSFYIGQAGGDTNNAGSTYVAYIFANDTTTDSLIKCGSFTTDASGVSSVTLGWEPQFILWKRTDVGGVNQNDWQIMDAARNFSAQPAACSVLFPSKSNAELQWNQLNVNSTGFKTTNAGYMAPSATFIYLAIRRPNKPPTLGTQVYNAIARTGTGAAATVTGVGFAPDLVMYQARSVTTSFGRINDRLRGASNYLSTSLTDAEVFADQTVFSFEQDGVKLGRPDLSVYPNTSGTPFINHFFKRAPGVFDVVCYTGDGLAGGNPSHSLNAIPEIIICKSRSTGNWMVSHGTTFANSSFLLLNSNVASGVGIGVATRNSTSTTFNIGTQTNSANDAGVSYVAYLFASKAGISKVFSYTGNGSNLTVNCGFTTGARFVLIKRTDAVGDWYVWDSTRGIVAGNDPHLSLNSTTAEVTSNDSIDPDTSGFIVNQLAATNINVTSATYIGMAFA